MVETWSKGVFSSMVAEIAYDAANEEMIVTWAKSGKRSAYAGVPEDVALQCSTAASVGEFINREIKPVYAHRYI